MIPPSKVEIISTALVQLGQRPIGSLEDTSQGAVAARNVYDVIRRSRLASFPWRFAMREVLLTPLPDEVTRANENDYTYAYSLPSSPAPLLIWGLQNMAPFGLYGNQVHANQTSPNLIYIADIDCPSLSAPFAEALALDIAAAIAITITEQLSKAQYFKSLALDAWKVARRADSQQAWLVSLPIDRVMGLWPSARG